MASVSQVHPVVPADVPDLSELENLPDSDGVPLETPWHAAQIQLCIDCLTHHWRARDDFFVGGNMFVYFSREQTRQNDFRGPDFFYVSQADKRRPRRYWAIWDEDGKYPNLILELLSPSTALADRTSKKDVYEKTFRTPEYFCYDPEDQRLEGWRLGDRRYQPIQADHRGWLWSEQLQLWLGTWTGDYHNVQQSVWVRFYDLPQQLVLTSGEAEGERAEFERQRAEVESRRADEERRRAETAARQAADGAQKIQALEAEVARLRAALEKRGGDS